MSSGYHECVWQQKQFMSITVSCGFAKLLRFLGFWGTINWPQKTVELDFFHHTGLDNEWLDQNSLSSDINLFLRKTSRT